MSFCLVRLNANSFVLSMCVCVCTYVCMSLFEMCVEMCSPAHTDSKWARYVAKATVSELALLFFRLLECGRSATGSRECSQAT